MEPKVTKELLNYLLRFRCPNCEFDTHDPILIQEHLFQCLKQHKNDVIGDSEVGEFMLDIKEEFTETDLSTKSPIVIKIKAVKPPETFDPEPYKAIEKVDDDLNEKENHETNKDHIGKKAKKRKTPKERVNSISVEHLKFYCNLCQKHFQTRSTTLKKHMRNVHEDPKFKCDKCDFVTRQGGHLLQHKRSKHEGFRHKCDSCEQTFSSKEGAKSHFRIVHLKEKFKCDICGKDYVTRNFLRKHISSVHYRARYKCDQCDQDFSFEKSLHDHILVRHKGIRKEYKCPQCNKSFSESRSLARHRRIEHEGIRFQCGECGKEYRQKDNLLDHIRTHHT